LYDLGDLENSRFIHSTGQSGNRLSPLYAQYLQRWVDVAYVPMRMERSAFEKNRLGTLRLIPQAR
jgi:penicillin amidase